MGVPGVGGAGGKKQGERPMAACQVGSLPPGAVWGLGGLLVDPGEGTGTLVCSRVVSDKVHVPAGLGAASSLSACLELQVGGHWPQEG